LPLAKEQNGRALGKHFQENSNRMCEIGIVSFVSLCAGCCRSAKQLSPQTFAQNKQRRMGDKLQGPAKGQGAWSKEQLQDMLLVFRCRTHVRLARGPWWQFSSSG